MKSRVRRLVRCDGSVVKYRITRTRNRCQECHQLIPKSRPDAWFVSSPPPKHVGPFKIEGVGKTRQQTCTSCGESWPTLSAILAQTYDQNLFQVAIETDSAFRKAILR